MNNLSDLDNASTPATDPVLREVKELRETVDAIHELLEELIEKISDLDLPYNSGFSYD